MIELYGTTAISSEARRLCCLAVVLGSRSKGFRKSVIGNEEVACLPRQSISELSCLG